MPHGRETTSNSINQSVSCDRSEEQSQMSYKPMTPKASPLPPGLQMQREPPVNQATTEEARKESPHIQNGEKGDEQVDKPVNQRGDEHVDEPVKQASDRGSAGSASSRLSKKSNHSQRSNQSGKLQKGSSGSPAAAKTPSPAAGSPQLKERQGSQGSLGSQKSNRSQQKE